MSNAATLANLTECVASELLAVDKLFHQELSSGVDAVNGLVRHVSRFRGKMLRPILVLLSGRAAGTLCDAHTVIATVVEMVHMATLVHDDVLDEAELRRKGATINHLRGNEAAVLLGDYLISHSFHLCSSLDSQLASRIIGRTTNCVCEGELQQIDNRNNLELDETTYLQIIARKTGSLCGASCSLGAVFAGANEAVARQFENFGLWLGTAFQIQDDILDIVGHPDSVGKTLGIDIEKGKLTLPLIHFLATAPHEHQALLKSLLEGHDTDKIDRIRNLILPGDAVPYAQNRAAQYIAKARAALQAAPDSDARRALDQMAEFVIARQW
jgi:octaprenyl-diphosphate synthase